MRALFVGCHRAFANRLCGEEFGRATASRRAFGRRLRFSLPWEEGQGRGAHHRGCSQPVTPAFSRREPLWRTVNVHHWGQKKRSALSPTHAPIRVWQAASETEATR